jgi:hypothetical protein
LNFRHLNPGSTVQHIGELNDLVKGLDMQLIAVSEIRFKTRHNNRQVGLNGFRDIRADRGGERRGGGVALYLRESLRYKVVAWSTPTSVVDYQSCLCYSQSTVVDIKARHPEERVDTSASRLEQRVDTTARHPEERVDISDRHLGSQLNFKIGHTKRDLEGTPRSFGSGRRNRKEILKELSVITASQLSTLY